ncbi:MAG: type II secretion system F family protein [Actinobacteria bacterium]|nr:type II secretion system F family protein [Actinomycetota bacterium]
MTGAVLVGLGVGGGVLLLVSGLVPAPAPLARELAAIHRRQLLRQGGGEVRLASVLGRLWQCSPFARRLTEPLLADLRITGVSVEQHLAERVVAGLTALLWAPVTAALMTLAGADIGLALPLWVSLLLAPVGFAYPTLALRSKAADRRRSFRHAFSAFLDVVSISLAGGRGVDSALHDGANAGQGWPFQELRRALLDARLRGETPWAGLNRLGHEVDVPELSELAASAALAGSEGARVRASLAAKARSLRLRGLLEIEGAAQSASELMSLPVVVLMFGFVVFLGYPAIAHVLQGI